MTIILDAMGSDNYPIPEILGAIKAKIIDATHSIFTPCTYKIELLKVLNDTKIVNNLNNLNEISSFRGRFCEQAVKGESVFVEGKLEEVTFKGIKTHQRILLTDQKHDKMIVTDP